MTETKVDNEVWNIDAEEELDKYFPKGDDRRGQAMVILATARLQAQEHIKSVLREHFSERFANELLNKIQSSEEKS